MRGEQADLLAVDRENGGGPPAPGCLRAGSLSVRLICDSGMA